MKKTMNEESSVLIIRHLPSVLSKDEKEDLLRHFGAVQVRCMPDSGRLRHTAFATFPSSSDAKYCLSRLHQMEVLGCHLVVEFAKPQQAKHFPHESDFKKPDIKQNGKETKLTEQEEIQASMEALYKKLHAMAPNFGLDYLSSPLLKYKYPPPTHSIITNMAHALAAVPKFYNQVLHLMNKMKLPAPFGPVTPAPPLFVEELPQQSEMELTEEESEIESDQDERRELPQFAKRPAKPSRTKSRKKLKLQLALPATPATREVNKPITAPSDVFEVPESEIGAKKIQFSFKQSGDGEDMVENPVLVTEEPSSLVQPPVQVEEGGFGVIVPQKSSLEETHGKSQDIETLLGTSEFVPLSEIRKNRLSSREMKQNSVFKNYASGDATYRLYVKNLAKQVEEKDLLRIYGRYINKHAENERNMFDIRLMKEGRMKGQAFVTLANVKQAVQALRDTNGYLLLGKPIVVQFARSARPKETK